MEAHAVCKTSVQETIKRYAKVFFFFVKHYIVSKQSPFRLA